MIVKGARKPTFEGLWRTSTVFTVLVASLPITILVLISQAFASSSLAIAVAPFVLLWKSALLFVFVRRRRSLAALDPLTVRERSDTNKKFRYLRTWWNYVILVILITAYCGMISYNAASGLLTRSVGYILQTVFIGVDTVSLACLIFVVARLHKRSREETRLRSKAMEAGEVDASDRDSIGSASFSEGDTTDYGETINGDASTTISVDTPPPAYNHGRAPPQVVCMMCATHIPHGEKVLIQPSLR